MGTIYKTCGEQLKVAPQNGKHFKLKELQKIVGGSIEILFLDTYKIMIVNEEGKLERLPVNLRATELVRKNGIDDIIVGDVLVCSSKCLE